MPTKGKEESPPRIRDGIFWLAVGIAMFCFGLWGMDHRLFLGSRDSRKGISFSSVAFFFSGPV